MEFLGLLFEFDAVFAQRLHVDLHAKVLHLGEHRQQRRFDGLEDVNLLLQLRPHLRGELPGHIRVLRGVVGDLPSVLRRDIGHGGLAEEIVLLGADEAGDRHGRVAQIRLRKVIHAVALIRIDQGVRQHGVKERPADLDAMRKQHAEVEFEVVADFLGALAGEHRAEFFEHGLRRGFFAREVHEPAFMRFP